MDYELIIKINLNYYFAVSQPNYKYRKNNKIKAFGI
jgi:hypothetical protein